jgi:dihydrofolate reductase
MTNRLVHIVAVAENGVIGAAGALPWHYREDLKRFKALTMGRPVIMGRKTFATLPSSLPGRSLYVISRSAPVPTQHDSGSAKFFPGLTEAYAAASRDFPTGEIFVAGGGEIYRQSLLQVGKVYLTLVHKSIEGDTTYPLEELRSHFVEDEAATIKHPEFAFFTFVRRSLS